MKTNDLKAILVQKGIKLVAQIDRAASIPAAAKGFLQRYCRRQSPTKEAQRLELDLELFKRSLGSASPAEFTAEGGLREHWAAAHRHELQYRFRRAIIGQAAALDVEADPWQMENRRKRIAAARNAALMLVAWTALSVLWSKTEWQHQLESALVQSNAAQETSPLRHAE